MALLLLRRVEYFLAFVLWLFYAGALGTWIGWFGGFVVAVFTAPGALLLPVIYWFVEDAWLTQRYYLWFYGAFLATSLGYWALDRRFKRRLGKPI